MTDARSAGSGPASALVVRPGVRRDAPRPCPAGALHHTRNRIFPFPGHSLVRRNPPPAPGSPQPNLSIMRRMAGKHQQSVEGAFPAGARMRRSDGPGIADGLRRPAATARARARQGSRAPISAVKYCHWQGRQGPARARQSSRSPAIPGTGGPAGGTRHADRSPRSEGLRLSRNEIFTSRERPRSRWSRSRRGNPPAAPSPPSEGWTGPIKSRLTAASGSRALALQSSGHVGDTGHAGRTSERFPFFPVRNGIFTCPRYPRSWWKRCRRRNAPGRTLSTIRRMAGKGRETVNDGAGPILAGRAGGDRAISRAISLRQPPRRSGAAETPIGPRLPVIPRTGGASAARST